MSFLWFLSNYRNPVTEALALGITEFGYQIIPIVFLAVIFWCFDKKTAYKAGFAFCISGLIVHGIIKIFVRIPRPWILDKDFTPVKKALKAATGFSFPSGHSQAATSIFGSFFTSCKIKWMKILCLIIPILVGLSRMFLGVHTPKDVLCGIGMGVLSIVLVEYAYPYLEKGIGMKALLLPLICMVASVIGVIEGYYFFSKGIIDYINVKDCFQCVGASIGFCLGYYLETKRIHFQMPKSVSQGTVRVFVGLIILVILKVGLKMITGENPFMACFSNLVLTFFITAGYPYLFEKIFKNRNGNAYEK